MSPLPPISARSSIAFGPLLVRPERGGTSIVGNPATGRFIEADDDVTLAIHLIRRHPTIGAAEAAWPRSRGEAPDLVALCQDLHRRGFVTLIDGAETPAVLTSRYSAPAPRFLWTRTRAANILLALLALVGTALFLLTPRFEPLALSDVRVARDTLSLAIALSVGFTIFAILHEVGHYMVTRSYGVPASVRLTQRYGIPVFITDVTNAWLLPRSARVRIFLAGIAVNVTIASLALCALTLSAFGLLHGAPTSALRFVVLLNLPPILFQLLIFAKTDLYYVLAALVDERNLSRDATSFVLGRLKGVIRRVRGLAAAPGDAISARRRAILVSFGLISIVGTGLCVLGFPFVLFVIAVGIGQLALSVPPALVEGGWRAAVGPALIALLGGLQLAVLVTLPIRDLRKKRRAQKEAAA